MNEDNYDFSLKRDQDLRIILVESNHKTLPKKEAGGGSYVILIIVLHSHGVDATARSKGGIERE